jgi:tetratricopeptide (TPR) repeat protein
MKYHKNTLFFFIFPGLILIGTGGLSSQTSSGALGEFRQENYPQAIEMSLAELEDNPGDMDSYAIIGWSLIKLERYKEAREYSLAGLTHNRDIRVLYNLGEANYHLGNNLEALKNFEEYAALSPTGGSVDEAYYYMGEIFIRLGEYHHADIALTTAVYYTANTARYWARLGYAREMAQDYPYALEAYDRALELLPAFSDALRGRERVRQKMAPG